MNVSLRARTSLLRLVQRSRTITSVPSENETTSSSSIDNFFDEFIENLGKSAMETSNKGLSFATMLRRSKFMQLGAFDGRVLIGKVMRRVADDLYIDLGLKFHAVCKAPAVNNEVYVRNALVMVRLHDPELSERFLGSSRDLTLLEADATLMRLVYSPLGTPKPRAQSKEQEKSTGSEESKEEVKTTESEESKEELKKNE
ncbi:hypothetical protein PMAYCL1PPCAC_02870 [Pristionchus mayeri]|uniref:Mrps-28 n=1 Tax=Pristionchus mayeri TaxID=1317129 RepID=A0AAN5C6N0_9BILA|nr:hypothetical protein PMAYCL1PPCAC_02870 [Pristionchus mayeri]